MIFNPDDMTVLCMHRMHVQWLRPLIYSEIVLAYHPLVLIAVYIWRLFGITFSRMCLCNILIKLVAMHSAGNAVAILGRACGPYASQLTLLPRLAYHRRWYLSAHAYDC